MDSPYVNGFYVRAIQLLPAEAGAPLINTLFLYFFSIPFHARLNEIIVVYAG